MSQPLFVTRLYKARIAPPAMLEDTILAIAAEDQAGRRWSKQHGYGGYTSYASLNDLTFRASPVAALEKAGVTTVKSPADLGATLAAKMKL